MLWCVFVIAQHDIPLVRLCSCWSRSCCHCHGKIAAKACIFISMDASLKENRLMKFSLKEILTYSLKKRLVCIYVMFAYEMLTVDGEEKHFTAVKLKRVCLPPSVEGAGMSQSLSWKLRRKSSEIAANISQKIWAKPLSEKQKVFAMTSWTKSWKAVFLPKVLDFWQQNTTTNVVYNDACKKAVVL